MRLKINITNLTETCVTSYVIILHVFSYKVQHFDIYIGQCKVHVHVSNAVYKMKSSPRCLGGICF